MHSPNQKKINSQRIKNVIGLILIPIVLIIILRFFEYVQVYRPRTELISDPKSIHPNPETTFIPSGNGYQLNGWFFSCSENSTWSDWVILVSHGNGGNISYRLDLYELWLDAGFNVMAYDYRGYGQSSGRPSEKGTYEDVNNVFQWLVTRGYEPSNIIALGESLGGAVATELATHQGIGGLVLQSTFTRITDIGKELYPWLPVATLSRIKYDTLAKLPSIELPLLIIHSREDTLIPFHHAEKNYSASNSPKLLREIGGNHNDGLLSNRDQYRRHIREFKQLLAAKKKPTEGLPLADE